MKLFYATSNNSKIHNMCRRLEGLPIELLTPKNFEIKMDVLEDGITAVENVKKKHMHIII